MSRFIGILTILTISCVGFNARGQTLQLQAADTAFCHGDSVLLEANSGFIAYYWSTGDTLPYTYASAAGMYFVIVVDATLNIQYDSIEISEFPIKNFGYELSPDTNVICAGDSIEIQLTEGFLSYGWSTGGDARRRWSPARRRAASGTSWRSPLPFSP
jgi:hypothetical protein